MDLVFLTGATAEALMVVELWSECVGSVPFGVSQLGVWGSGDECCDWMVLRVEGAATVVLRLLMDEADLA